ncbi:MAG: translation initiation factor IF-2 [Flavobacteriales bacterium]|nr:translation initiation factor IF-2 [Flavobacteriales bacterium]
MRLSKVAKELNISIQRIGEFIESSGYEITVSPNTKLSDDLYDLLLNEFKSDLSQKQQSDEVLEAKKQKEALRDAVSKNLESEDLNPKKKELTFSKVTESEKTSKVSEQLTELVEEVAPVVADIPKVAEKLAPVLEKEKNDVDVEPDKKDEDDKSNGKIKLKKLGTIKLPEKTSKKKRVASSSNLETKKKKRKRIFGDSKSGPKKNKIAPNEEEVKNKIAETLEQLTSKGKSKSAKIRREKRQERKEKAKEDQLKQAEESTVIKVTEFVTVSEFANMMNVSVTEVISSCMQLGIMVTMNQRLDAETLSIVADEFEYKVEFVSAELEEFITDDADADKDSESPRSPIVTVMGHVDHGKTSLLDYIRKSNIIAGEAGGITQHIAAYEVTLGDERKITFIDTPGHEAFTAMRARGAQVTDVVIIVIAVDDDVMPQTKEAISHAQAADVPMIFAFNKIDKPNANPDKIKEQLSNMNLLVEDWGGKYQSQDVSAKTGQGIDELLEKVLLESELLNLTANANKLAKGTVLEASLDKGKGYVTTVLVQEGSLKIGDFMLAGRFTGKVKALFNERDQKANHIPPSTPVTLLGLNGAPQAGDVFYVRKDEKEAKSIAAKRDQLQREQSVRTQKHITLDEIGRRLAIGDFKELNIILKGDVDGSIEALSDSLLKLSTEKIQINVIHKAVGQITESDVLLASASDAIIIGFQVRPSMSARKLAEKEKIDIRLYSIIYDTINSIKDAIEGMHEPEMIEEILGNIEIRNVFKLTKAGIVAGCYVLDGSVNRGAQVRLIRDGIVIYTGVLDSLKRFKEDVKDVQKGYECGLTIHNFNDIKVGDIVEAFHNKAST